MFTKCPHCETEFRVTAPMIEAAQGRVRCERCGNLFNALTVFPLHASSVSPAIDAPAAGDPLDAPIEISDSELENIFIESPPHLKVGEEDEDVLELEAIDDPDDTIERPVLEFDASDDGNDETAEHEIVDIDTGEVEMELEVELEVDDSPEETITLEGDSISIVNEATGEFKTNFEVEEPQEEEEKVKVEVEEDFSALAPRHIRAPATTREKILWGAGSAILVAALAAQIVHFNRQALALHASVGPVLTRLYAAFGSELSPAWDLQAYEVRQWGAAADAGANGALKVRASVFNGAAHPQPFPILRLTLQDRFGGRIGARDLEPDEYLQSSDSAPRGLGAGERVDAQIAVVDPGKDAVGFEIDVCLRGEHNRVKCANDAQQKTGVPGLSD